MIRNHWNPSHRQSARDSNVAANLLQRSGERPLGSGKDNGVLYMVCSFPGWSQARGIRLGNGWGGSPRACPGLWRKGFPVVGAVQCHGPARAQKPWTGEQTRERDAFKPHHPLLGKIKAGMQIASQASRVSGAISDTRSGLSDAQQNLRSGLGVTAAGEEFEVGGNEDKNFGLFSNSLHVWWKWN